MPAYLFILVGTTGLVFTGLHSALYSICICMLFHQLTASELSAG